VLQGLTVREALGAAERRFLTVPLDTPLEQVVRLITGTQQTCFPVVDEAGAYRGLFSLNDVRQFLYESDIGALAVAHDLATVDVEPLGLDTDLGSAIGRFAAGRFDELPVIDDAQPMRVVAMLRRQDVIAAYNAGLMKLRTDAAAT
jgi:chloride channel protein, CIC family